VLWGSGSAFILVGWIRIRIDFGRLDPDPEGKKTQRKEKSKDFMLEVLDVLF
jgi:hypothetical protein